MFWRLPASLFLLIVCGCSGPMVMPGNTPPALLGLVRLEATRSFELPTPYSTKLGTRKRAPIIQLGRGRYTAHFADSGGTYYAAPFSQNAELHFSGGRRGGVYVVRTATGPRAYLYYQQNQPGYYYAQGVGSISMGGDNAFTIGDELPADFVSLIQNQIL